MSESATIHFMSSDVLLDLCEGEDIETQTAYLSDFARDYDGLRHVTLVSDFDGNKKILLAFDDGDIYVKDVESALLEMGY